MSWNGTIVWVLAVVGILFLVLFALGVIHT